MTGRTALPSGTIDERAVGEVLAVARRLGRDPAELLAGAELRFTHALTSLQEAREVVSRADARTRTRRGQTFPSAFDGTRPRVIQGIYDRCDAYVFADGPFPEHDAALVARRFPLPLEIVLAVSKVVPAGEELELSARPAAWRFPGPPQLPVLAMFGTLVLEPGARVVARGTTLSLFCGRLVHLGEPGGPDDVDIGLLHAPGAGDARGGPPDGVPGRAGEPGTAGTAGRSAPVESSILGPLTLCPPSPGEMVGRAGLPGGPGGRGRRGGQGAPTRSAEITLRAVVGGPIVVFAQPGHGGDGGPGGAGGRGGAGGAGGAGCRSLAGPVPGGAGGPGGPGGAGGPGGRGGDGGIASPVYITCPPDQEHRLRRVAVPAEAGHGGSGGPGGIGGRGGRGGSGPTPELAGRAGPYAAPGLGGRDGSAGRPGPAPPIFLNERL